MKIIHVLYSGMGGHGDVVFPKIQNDKNNENIIFFVGIEKILKIILHYARNTELNIIILIIIIRLTVS